jgi:hypothetical protein
MSWEVVIEEALNVDIPLNVCRYDKTNVLIAYIQLFILYVH